jgi:hypothetical protein
LSFDFTIFDEQARELARSGRAQLKNAAQKSQSQTQTTKVSNSKQIIT